MFETIHQFLLQLPIWAWILITWLVLLSITAITDHRKGEFEWGNLFLKGFAVGIVAIILGIVLALSLTTPFMRVLLILGLIYLMARVFVPGKENLKGYQSGFDRQSRWR